VLACKIADLLGIVINDFIGIELLRLLHRVTGRQLRASAEEQHGADKDETSQPHWIDTARSSGAIGTDLHAARYLARSSAPPKVYLICFGFG
jgi:hypothetical protein